MSESAHTYRSRIPASAERLRAWHESPGAFDRLTPPWVNTQVIDSQGGVAPGDWKRLRVKAIGPFGFTWKLVHHENNDAPGFIDVQEAGPFRSWRHEHSFHAESASTSLLEDRITYELPLGPAGQALAGNRVETMLDELFTFRHNRTQFDLGHHLKAGPPAPLRIAVTGSTGLVGGRLVPFLRAGGHHVVRLVRHQPQAQDEIFWDPGNGQIDATALEGLDAVVHLAGASIAGRRWTQSRKDAILNSRLDGTSLLAGTLAQLKAPPAVFVSTSAVGFYGDGGSQILTEASPAGGGFLAGVCEAWEKAAKPAADAGIRVVHPRFGVVLAGEGGFLPLIARVFQFGMGGPLGSGEQYMSWIALDDLLGIILQLIVNDRLHGPVNAAAPGTISNTAFSSILGEVLGRPSFLRTPAFAVRLAAGQQAEELILVSQRVIPARLQEQGFRFAFPSLERALRHELGRYEQSPGPVVATASSTGQPTV